MQRGKEGGGDVVDRNHRTFHREVLSIRWQRLCPKDTSIEHRSVYGEDVDVCNATPVHPSTSPQNNQGGANTEAVLERNGQRTPLPQARGLGHRSGW